MWHQLESAGFALLGAGVWLILLICLGAYMQKGFEGVVNMLNPLTLENYAKLLELVPGLLLLFFSRRHSRDRC